MQFLAVFPDLEAGPVFLIGSGEPLRAELRVAAPLQLSSRRLLNRTISDTLETAA